MAKDREGCWTVRAVATGGGGRGREEKLSCRPPVRPFASQQKYLRYISILSFNPYDMRLYPIGKYVYTRPVFNERETSFKYDVKC